MSLLAKTAEKTLEALDSHKAKNLPRTIIMMDALAKYAEEYFENIIDDPMLAAYMQGDTSVIDRLLVMENSDTEWLHDQTIKMLNNPFFYPTLDSNDRIKWQELHIHTLPVDNDDGSDETKNICETFTLYPNGVWIEGTMGGDETNRHIVVNGDTTLSQLYDFAGEDIALGFLKEINETY